MVLVNQVKFFFFYWHRKWSSQLQEELRAVCVRFNTLQRVLFPCYARTAFTEWLTYLCSRLQLPLPSSDFPKALHNSISLAAAEAGMSFLFPAALCRVAGTVCLQNCANGFLPEPGTAPAQGAAAPPAWHSFGGNLFSSRGRGRNRSKASLLRQGEAALKSVRWRG